MGGDFQMFLLHCSIYNVILRSFSARIDTSDCPVTEQAMLTHEQSMVVHCEIGYVPLIFIILPVNSWELVGVLVLFLIFF